MLAEKACNVTLDSRKFFGTVQTSNRQAFIEEISDMAIKEYKHHVLVCFGKRCTAKGSERLLSEFKRRIKDGTISKASKAVDVRLSRTGCLKLCKETRTVGEHSPGVIIYPEGVWYASVKKEDVDEIIESHLKNGSVVERLCYLKMKDS